MKKIRLFFLLGTIGVGMQAKAQVPGSSIDVQHYNFNITLNDENDSIKGNADITIKYLKDSWVFKLDLVKLNSKGLGMEISRISENGENIKFEQDSERVTIHASAEKSSTHTYNIIYTGIPADGLIISTNKFKKRTFFGDNWATRAHNWLPCVDDPMDKATLDFIVTAPAHYQVVANGLKQSETSLPGNLKRTHWKETAQLPTKVMVIGVANFAIDHPGDVNGIPVYTYVFPENSAVGFKSYAVAARILPFFIDKIGPYAYKKLANVQSKTIYGGMENASAIFYFENSVSTPDIEELMAHEIAHQWFGDAVSEKSWSTAWLSEGFATYLTHYYLENTYGADSLRKRMITDRTRVLKFEKKRFTPIVDTSEKKDLTILLNDNTYQKGGWVLHMLRRKLGDDVFWKGIRTYFAKYNGSNANTDDLRLVMEQVSGQDLQNFFKQWLFTPGHPDLAIQWKYDATKHMVNIQVTQKQNNLYKLPLEVAVDGKVQTINIADKETSINLSAEKKPTTIIADPNVNLLASFTITAGQ